MLEGSSVGGDVLSREGEFWVDVELDVEGS